MKKLFTTLMLTTVTCFANQESTNVTEHKNTTKDYVTMVSVITIPLAFVTLITLGIIHEQKENK